MVVVDIKSNQPVGIHHEKLSMGEFGVVVKSCGYDLPNRDGMLFFRTCNGTYDINGFKILPGSNYMVQTLNNGTVITLTLQGQ